MASSPLGRGYAVGGAVRLALHAAAGRLYGSFCSCVPSVFPLARSASEKAACPIPCGVSRRLARFSDRLCHYVPKRLVAMQPLPGYSLFRTVIQFSRCSSSINDYKTTSQRFWPVPHIHKGRNSVRQTLYIPRSSECVVRGKNSHTTIYKMTGVKDYEY